MSEDPTMIRMFMEDLDIHSETAAKMFKIPLDQVDKIRHRRPAKSIGFGVIYGMGPYKLQEQMLAEGIKYTEQECKELIDMWFGVYPGIYAYMDQIKADARRLGLVRDYFGRYRLIPETISTVPRIVHAGLRQAGNFPIQSMAQQIIKQAMVELVPVYRDLQEGGLWRCDPVLQIHDELVWEISDEIIETAVPVIKSIMESAVELVVPTPVDSNIGQTWGELK
jgi:DNA polymerase-1